MTMTSRVTLSARWQKRCRARWEKLEPMLGAIARHRQCPT